VVGRHRMELYGICAECREGKGHEVGRQRGVQRV
jgi:hypothetical protein